MTIEDLEFVVPRDIRCHVYKEKFCKKDENGKYCYMSDKDIFDDYFGGIKFSDLMRYPFVARSTIVRMEPKHDKLLIVID